MHIRKVAISDGVYWVEIPGANLRILCAAPEDSVKHLIRRGFIHDVVENTVTFETGPNAILLSDNATQNGSFCNVAEFPVLQMLYRQGMIIPGHPGNIGQKPLLIGSEAQVRAQLAYIFRGNYGLINEEELIEAGLSAEEAQEQMRLKLKFAFGAIKSPREMLDICVVEDEIAHIRGAYIARVAPNVFEISYGGETVEVNLNLGPSASYQPPYHLGYHALNREYFAVVHSGDGDGWDSDRPSMSSIVMFQGRIYLIDAGPNIANTLKSLGIGISEVEGLFLTHAHDDHFAGVTTLMRANHPIKFFSTRAVRASAIKKLSALINIQEDEFVHFFTFVDLLQGVWNDIEGMEVQPVFSPHPVETTCMLFRAIAEGGYKTYAHMADTVSLKVLEDMITEDENAPGVSRDLYERVVETYAKPADIKKIDVGGGMIHGEAVDFIDDKSEKMVLAHRATPLTPEERRIGAGAPFGTVDVLITGNQDYTYQKAARLLHAYFPEITRHTLQTLLNGPIVQYNPESFIARAGISCDRPILLLSGQVERLDEGGTGHAQMPAGAIIGELSVIDRTPLQDTYRAISFVTTLHIPSEPFRHFSEQQNLVKFIHERAPMRAFLQRTSVFSDNMSRRLLLELGESSERIVLKDGETLNWAKTAALYLVDEGSVDLVLDGETREQLGQYQFFGETFVLFGVPPVYDAKARGDTTLVCVNAQLTADIPVARWKLLEGYLRRIHQMVVGSLKHDDAFLWVDEFLLHIDDMDAQHQKLFSVANVILGHLIEQNGPDHVAAALQDLVTATQEHFAAEEVLLDSIKYPKTHAHQNAHGRLLGDMRDLRDRVRGGDLISPQEFRSFFLSWIVYHILGEDRQYAKHMEQMKNLAI